MATSRSTPARKAPAAKPVPATKVAVKTAGLPLAKAPAAAKKVAAKPELPPKAAPKAAPPAAGQAAAPSAPRPAREKLVRDGFTFPANEYERIGAMKKRALALGGDAKKSEIVRAALNQLATLANAEFMVALAAVPRIKTGRKKKDKAA
jgi:hypothetical protein